jgi:hypothetical protein
MHPVFMESIAEQRLEDLRTDRHPVVVGNRRRGPGRARNQSGRGPVNRVEAKVGVWMMATGWRLVRNGTSSPLSMSVPTTPAKL